MLIQLSMKKKYIIISLSIILLGIVTLLFFYVGYLFSPGSYPFSEKYELNVSDEKLIELIQDIKVKHPEICVPENVYIGNNPFHLTDGDRDKYGNYYHVYFYFQEEQQIIHTIIGGNKHNSIIRFYAVNDGLILGRWKEINSEFWGSAENDNIKLKFEERILSKIKVSIKNYKNK